MGSVAKQTVSRLKEFNVGDVGDVGDRMSAAVNVVSGQVSRRLNDLSGKAVAAVKATDAGIRSKPWQAVGAIALVGLAAGMVVSMGAQRLRQRAQASDSADVTNETLGG